MPPKVGLTTARTRLAELRDKTPASTAARIRVLWPEIKAALDRGHSLKDVCDCLQADGLALSVQALGSYISRIRRKTMTDQSETVRRSTPGEQSVVAEVGRVGSPRSSKDSIEPHDPLANLRRSQAERPKFDYRPELADPDKLI